MTRTPDEKAELACPGDNPRDDTWTPCGCAKADDGHCQWCCRPLAEHAGSPQVLEGMEEIFRRLRATESALAVSQREREWQPIETAPKDGTELLLGGRQGVDIGSWEADVIAAIESGVEVACGAPEGWYGITRYDASGPQPTHWMPLPSSPASLSPQCPNDLTR